MPCLERERERIPVCYRRIIPGTVANKNDWNGCAWIRFGGDGGRGGVGEGTDINDLLGLASRPCLPVSPSVQLQMNRNETVTLDSLDPTSFVGEKKISTFPFSFRKVSLIPPPPPLFCSSVPKHRHKKRRASLLKTEGMPTSRRIRTNFADRQRRVIRVHQHLFPGAERDHRIPASL